MDKTLIIYQNLDYQSSITTVVGLFVFQTLTVRAIDIEVARNIETGV